MEIQDSVREKKAEKLGRHLVYLMAKAVRKYGMISHDDRIMVCHSGGKDSFALLDLLLKFKRQSPEKFHLSVVVVDHNFPGFKENEQVLTDYFIKTGVEHHIIRQDIYGVLKSKIPPGKNMCGLCSRLRRGLIYRFAEENNMKKIALGHHRDDLVETFFMNIFHSGKIKSMPPKFLSEKGHHIVVRPMAFISEEYLTKYAELKKFPVIPGNLCGSAEDTQRQAVKEMLKSWNRDFPGRVETVFNSMQNVKPTLMADADLFDFKDLSTK